MIIQQSYDFPETLPLDRTPWKYFHHASEEERKRQSAWQTHLRTRPGMELTLEGTVFLSEQATVSSGTLSMGNESYIGAEAQVGGQITIGSHCTVNAGAVVRGEVTLGDGVRIASGAQILGFNHGTQDLTKPIYQQPVSSIGITLGDDIWVGANAVILDGVTIGSHAIVGAGAIVTKDVPEWAVVGGNPARILKDRRTPRYTSTSSRADTWSAFQHRVENDIPDLLTYYLDPETGTPRDIPGEQERMRPWCDMVEIAATVGAEIPGWSREALIETIRGFQDPETGLVPGPYGEKTDWEMEGGVNANRLEDRHSAYGVMSAGYALECLGSHLAHPVQVADDLRHADLHQHLNRLQWTERAWGAGAWVDHYASAMAFNALYHGGDTDLSDLFGWLNLHIDPITGTWGRPSSAEGMLQPVNGFYRLTRGSYAQWGIPLPCPERTIDTVLTHACDQRHVSPGNANACYILDIIHPLWLCLRQTRYRRKDCETHAAYWLQDTALRWRKGQGLSFHTAEGSPQRLQGTEMWLSIAWLCADLLGLDTRTGYQPRGVHRPEPIVTGQHPV